MRRPRTIAIQRHAERVTLRGREGANRGVTCPPTILDLEVNHRLDECERADAMEEMQQ